MTFKEYKKRKLLKNKTLRKEYLKLKRDRGLCYKIGNSIKIARHSKNMTQKELAKIINTHQPSVARVENGSQFPTIPFLIKIADALDTTAEQLLFTTSTEITKTFSNNETDNTNSRLNKTQEHNLIESPFYKISSKSSSSNK